MYRGGPRCSRGSDDLPVRWTIVRLVLRNILTGTCSVGHHSTSDDSFAYRPRQEVEDRKRIDNPIARFRLFLESRGWWSVDEEESYKAEIKKEIMKAFKRGENLPRSELKEMFTDVYGGEEPWNIVSTMSTGQARPFSRLL